MVLFGVAQFGNLPNVQRKQLRKFIVDDEMKISPPNYVDEGIIPDWQVQVDLNK